MNPIIPTVVIPTYNSAEFLDDCLRSVAGCPRILIHDCGSTDDTLDIARAHGARVRVFGGQTWDVFPEYTFRNRLIADAPAQFPETTHVVILDSDEVLSHNWLPEVEANAGFGLFVDYYQLLAHPSFMQHKNVPIELRLLVAPVGVQLFEDSGRVGPHQTRASYKPSFWLPTIKWFHLGYTGDLATRWRRNFERRDWGDTNESTYVNLQANPYPWDNVYPIANHLVDSCLTLRQRIARTPCNVQLIGTRLAPCTHSHEPQ